MGYVKNKDLYIEIVISKAQGKLTRKASEMLYLMGKKIQTKFSYKDLDDRHDCLQSAMESVYKNWYSFNSDVYDNAFSYYTEIIKRGLAKGWNEIDKGRDAISYNRMYEDGSDFNI